MAQINDQVIPELAEDFGSAQQNSSGVVNENIQATAAVEQYRRIMRSTRESFTFVGTEVAVNLNFQIKREETRRYFLVRLEHTTGAVLRIIGTIQRGSSAELLKQVLNGTVGSARSVFVVGKYERLSMSQPAGSSLMFPDEIVQPLQSLLNFKITVDGGGAIPAGMLTFESSYWREPPLRRWGSGPPTSTAVS